MDASIGDLAEPRAELTVQVIAVAEAAAKEEILTDVAERPLNFPLGLRPIGFAGLWQVTVMAGELDQGAVVDDEARLGTVLRQSSRSTTVFIRS